MRRKNGFTLFEMAVVITVGGALTGIAVFLLCALMKNYNTSRERLECRRTINRLAQQFRSDAHEAKTISTDAAGTTFDSSTDDDGDHAIVRYQCLAGRIDRGELQGGKIVRRESYVLGPNLDASIRTEEQEGTTIAVMAISPRQQMEKLYYPAPTRIEAVLGRDFRVSSKALPKSSSEDRP
jgi:prepilin-type N-terminal cleavage/methylation domain-containing protein